MMSYGEKHSMSTTAQASCGEASYYTCISLMDALFVASIFVVMVRSLALLLGVVILRG